MRLDNICKLAIDGSIAKILKSRKDSILQHHYKLTTSILSIVFLELHYRNNSD